MRHSESTSQFGRSALFATAAALALTACGGSKSQEAADDAPPPAANVAAAPAAAAPAAANTDTITGVKYASYTGDPVKGKTAFATCTTCHAIEAGVNKIGPSLHGVVGRPAGSIPNFTYSAANKGSGITWTPEKLFQYLENPQRVVPGTKMGFPGYPDPQTRADVIAYLKTNA